METFDVESDEKSGGGSLLKILLGVLCCVLLLGIIVSSVILTLPPTLTCFPHDARWFVRLVPNATIESVSPPMVCVAQSEQMVRIDGAHFLRYNMLDENEDDGGEARYFFLRENATQSNETITSVQNQGKYEIAVRDEKRVSRVGPSFAEILHPGVCLPSTDECTSFDASLNNTAEELSITWNECVEGMTHLTVQAEPDGAANVYDLFWPETQFEPMFRQNVESCSSFNVTFPVHNTERPIVPELFVQQYTPVAHHAVDAAPTKESGPCQHSSFGRLIFMPVPIVTDLNPPAVCKQHKTAILTLSGQYLVKATAFNESEVKANHILSRTATSGGVVANKDNMFSVQADFEVDAQKLTFSECDIVDVDRYDKVETCSQVALEIDGSQHGSTATVAADAPNPSAQDIAPLSALSVRNPKPIDCVTSSAVEFRVVDTPVINRIEPPLLCVAEKDRSVTFVAETAAQAFLRVDGNNVTTLFNGSVRNGTWAVTAHDECVALPLLNHEMEMCRRATHTVSQQATTETDVPTITVQSNHINAECDADATGSLVLIPAPTVVSLEPPFLCHDSTVVVTLTGRYFVEHERMLPDAAPLAKPSVIAMSSDHTFDEAAISLVDDSCVDLSVRQYTRAVNCSALDLTVVASDLAGANTTSLQALRVTNPAPADCTSVEDLELLVVPKPTVERLLPLPLVCVSESDQTITVEGTGFLRILNETEGDPVVFATAFEMIPIRLAIAAFKDCSPLPNTQRLLETCNQLDVVVPKTAFESLVGSKFDIEVRLARQASATPQCVSSTQTMAIVAKPVLTTLPTISGFCEGTEVQQAYEFEGDWFLKVSGEGISNNTQTISELTFINATSNVTLPDVQFSNCSQPEVVGRITYERCTKAIVTLGMNDVTGAAASQFSLGFAHPPPFSDDCKAVSPQLFTVVRKPEIIAPPLVSGFCRGQSMDQTFEFETDWILQNPSDASTNTYVELLRESGGMPVAVTYSLADCASEMVSLGGVMYQRCKKVIVSISSADVAASSTFALKFVHAAVVTPAICDTTDMSTFAIVDKPTLASVSPSSVCIGSAGVSVTATGSFDVIDGVTPFVDIQGARFGKGSVSGCGTANAAKVAKCTSIAVTLDPETAAQVQAGQTDVSVGLNSQCIVTLSNAITGLPTPNIATVMPPRICHTTASSLTLSGSRFALPPTLQVQLQSLTSAFQSVTVTGATMCTPIPNSSLQSCATAQLSSFQPNTLGLLVGDDDTAVAVRAANAACEFTNSDVLQVVPVPIIENVMPPEVCFDQETVVTITGSRFSTNNLAQLALINDVDGTIITEADGMFSIVSKSNTAIVITVLSGKITAAQYDVQITNVDGCVDLLDKGLHVHPTLIVAFAAPPILYNGINIRVTVFAAGLLSKLDYILLKHATTGVEKRIESADTTHLPTSFNKIFFTIESGLAVGEYDIEIVSRIGCKGVANRVLASANDTAVEISQVTPPHLEATIGGGVFVTVDAMKATLEAGVVAYLSPTLSTPNDVAIELTATTLQSSTLLTGVVPTNQRAVAYDLILVNPSRSVAVQSPGIFLVPNAIADVDGASPVVWEQGTTQDIVMQGANFASSNELRAVLKCKASGADTQTVETMSICPTGTCNSAGALTYPCPACDSNTIVVRTPSSSTTASGSVCVIELIDQLNANATSLFAAISVKNPSGKFASGFNTALPRQTPALLAARHAHAGINVQVNKGFRMLCVFGGLVDFDATDATPLDSVECATISSFGEVGAFQQQRYSLAVPAAYSAAITLGKFVYLVGGRSGGANAAALTAVQRAYILQPSEAPAVSLDFQLDPQSTAKFAQGNVGVYYYAISAQYDDNDASNPAGESLPSSIISLQVPDVAGLSVVLTWPQASLDNVVAYNIYRTPSANLLPTNMTRLITVSVGDVCSSGTCSWLGTGAESALPTAQQTKPLPLGSFGRWHMPAAAQLSGARFGATVVSMPAKPSDPSDTRTAIFAIGGRETTASLTTVERLVVDVTRSPDCTPAERCARETHGVVGWIADSPLTQGRAFASPVVVTRDQFNGLAENQHVILMANGIGAGVDRFEQGEYSGADCTNAAGTTCLTWINERPSRNGPLLNQQNCFLYRAGQFMYFAGAGSSWSPSNQFGMALASDVGQEQTSSMYSAGDVIPNVGGMGGVNTRSANPPAVAGAPCVIENGNLYLLGGYTGSGTVVATVNRLTGI